MNRLVRLVRYHFLIAILASVVAVAESVNHFGHADSEHSLHPVETGSFVCFVLFLAYSRIMVHKIWLCDIDGTDASDFEPDNAQRRRLQSAPTSAPSAPPTNVHISSCPLGWMVGPNKCYWMHGGDTTFSACEALCGTKQATVLCVENGEENDFVYSNHPTVKNGIWLGLNDVVSEGVYVWQPGCPSTLINWYSSAGEPNNFNGNEDCGEIRSLNTAGSGMWNDQSCTNTRGCTCETTHMQATNLVCPVSWTVASDGSCYKFTFVPIPRLLCESTCIAMESDLLCINNDQQRNLVASLRPGRDVWTGYNKLSGSWQWQSGCSSTYASWDATASQL